MFLYLYTGLIEMKDLTTFSFLFVSSKEKISNSEAIVWWRIFLYLNQDIDSDYISEETGK